MPLESVAHFQDHDDVAGTQTCLATGMMGIGGMRTRTDDPEGHTRALSRKAGLGHIGQIPLRNALAQGGTDRLMGYMTY